MRFLRVGKYFQRENKTFTDLSIHKGRRGERRECVFHFLMRYGSCNRLRGDSRPEAATKAAEKLLIGQESRVWGQHCNRAGLAFPAVGKNGKSIIAIALTDFRGNGTPHTPPLIVPRALSHCARSLTIPLSCPLRRARVPPVAASLSLHATSAILLRSAARFRRQRRRATRLPDSRPPL